MFIVCEPIARGLEHVPVNAALLKTICLAFPEESIQFYGEDSHLQEVRKEAGVKLADSIKWSTVTLPPRHASFYKRLCSDFKIIQVLLNRLNDNPSKHVLFITFGNSSILWALKYYVSTIHKDKKVQVVLHGDFSKLRYRGSLKQHLNPLYHLGSLNTALRIPGYKGIQHIVLEDAVRNAVIEVMPFLSNSIHVIDHPIPVDETLPQMNKLRQPVKFGFLGAASERKGFLKYLAVVADISKRFPGLASFHFIGRIRENQKNLNLPGIESLVEKPDTKRLTRNEYIERLNNLHYVCLFYEKAYEFTASGVLLDCIAYHKPLIASPLPIFNKLYQDFGNIGYLCRDFECSEVIEQIIKECNPDNYAIQVHNMQKVKSVRTPESLSEKYSKLVRILSD